MKATSSPAKMATGHACVTCVCVCTRCYLLTYLAAGARIHFTHSVIVGTPPPSIVSMYSCASRRDMGLLLRDSWVSVERTSTTRPTNNNQTRVHVPACTYVQASQARTSAVRVAECQHETREHVHLIHRLAYVLFLLWKGGTRQHEPFNRRRRNDA